MVQDAIIELSLWSKFHVNVTILKALFFSFFFNKGSKVLNHSNSMCSSCGLVIHCGSAVWHNYLLADEGVNKKNLVCVWSWHHLVTVCMIIGIVFHFCVEEKHHFCMVYIINFLWTNHFTWWCLTHASSSFFFPSSFTAHTAWMRSVTFTVFEIFYFKLHFSTKFAFHTLFQWF